MTSRAYFRNSMRLTWDQFRRNLWLNALFSVAFFFSMPLFTVITAQNGWQRIAQGLQTDVQVGEALTAVFSLENKLVSGIIIAGAVVAGLMAFAYLHNRNRTDFYHALPVRREALFLANYLSGFLGFLIPYLVMLGISLLLVVATGFIGVLNAGTVLSGILLNILFFLFIYSVAVLAANLCGNLVVSILGSGVLLGIVPALASLVLYFITRCYQTFFGSLYGLQNLITYGSPVSIFLMHGEDRPMGGLCIFLCCLATVLLVLAAFFLYRKRPSEAAGHAMAFRWARPVVKYPIVLVITLLGGLIFESVGYDSLSNALWTVFGFACGAVLSHVVLEVIFDFDVKSWKNGLAGLGAFAVGFAAVASIVAFDLTGFDTYVPEEDQVVSVQMDLTSGMLDSYTRNFRSSLYEKNNGDSVERVTFTDPEVIRAALGIAREGVANLDGTVFREETDGEFGYVSGHFSVVYRLAGGRQVARQYNLALSRVQEQLETIFDSREYREKTFPILGLDSLEGFRAYAKSLLTDEEINSDREFTDQDKVDRLAEAYRQDYEEFTYQDSLDEAPVAVLYLYKDRPEREDLGYFLESGGDFYSRLDTAYEYSRYPVYPSFKRTLGLLRELGVECPEKVDVAQLEAINVELYANNYVTLHFSEPDKMEQLLENLVLEGQMEYVTSYGDVYRSDYEVALQFVGGEEKDYRFVGNYRRDKMPQLIQKEWEKSLDGTEQDGETVRPQPATAEG